ncbi:sulfhydrogenase subunit alpha [Desulfovibrionales bacterium]
MNTKKKKVAKESQIELVAVDHKPVADLASVTASSQAGPKNIHVHHITRVEGHGNVVVEIDEHGTVSTCRWEISEAPRFFEAMLLGRSHMDVHQIVSRICGICSIGHQLSSLQATEGAMEIKVSEQTVRLRKLALHAENMQSHLLHLGYLVLPDFLGVPSVLALVNTHPAQIKNLVSLHRLANNFSKIICGRTTHPQRLIPGGMSKLPMAAELKTLRQSLHDSIPNLTLVSELFAALKEKLPDFNRKTEYIALVSTAEYPFYWGEIGSSMDTRKPTSFYKDMTREYCVSQSTAKWTRNSGESFMVGALARFNLNAQWLHHSAQKIAQAVGLQAPCYNPYYNNLAQLVEVFHSVEDSILLIDILLDCGLKAEPTPYVITQAGKGVGAVEVPRGILYHAYEYDKNGRIVHADCVIPTNQNHANIQNDLNALVPLIKDRSEAEIELITSMLVRAYDPCISCSTHVIDLTRDTDGNRGVRFVRKG